MTNGADSTGRPGVVILTPVFNEAECLPVYESRVTETLLSRSDLDFRVLFIDDGSSDTSWSVICDICKRNPCFEGIRLSRNYGSHIALSAGFAHARGDAFATLACDLQDPPETVLDFVGKWQDGARIVWGRRRSRKDDTWRVLTSRVFHRLIRRFAMPRGSKFTTGSFLLVDRKVAECYRSFHEQNRITFALVAWTGFEQAVVDYDRKKRVSGASGWTFGKMIKTMYDAFVGFSQMPIRLITLAGVGAFVLAIVLAVYLLTSWLGGSPVPGWTSLMFTMVVFFGVQFLLMGVMGEYLYRIYMEAVRRPLFFVSETTTSTCEVGEEPALSRVEMDESGESRVTS